MDFCSCSHHDRYRNGTLDGKTTGDLFLVYARTGEQRSSFLVEKIMPGFLMGISTRTWYESVNHF